MLCRSAGRIRRVCHVGPEVTFHLHTKLEHQVSETTRRLVLERRVEVDMSRDTVPSSRTRRSVPVNVVERTASTNSLPIVP